MKTKAMSLVVLGLLTVITDSARGADPPEPAQVQTASKEAPAGIFVAVGYGGRRMSSRDGIHWENVQQWVNKAEDDSNNLISLAYGKGKFVAVGGGGWSRDTQAGHILVSSDGAHWRETKKMAFRISPILFTAGKFVAGGPEHQLLWSDDAETWSESPKVEVPKGIPGWAFWFRGGIAGDGTFIFTGNANTDQKTWWCITTHDGKTIDSFASNLPPVNSLAFGAGTFLLVSGSAIYTTKDGKVWHKELGAPTDKFRQAVYTGSEFFLSGEKFTYTSVDGISWKVLGKPIPCEVSWSNGSLFIGTGWPGKVWTSSDGRNWTRGDAPQPELGINQIVHGAVLGGTLR
jgi:hypothetical protein